MKQLSQDDLYFQDSIIKNPLKNEDLKLILEAAIFAPTHKKTEPWRFKVLQNDYKIKFANFLSEKYKTTTTKFSKYKFQKIINK